MKCDVNWIPLRIHVRREIPNPTLKPREISIFLKILWVFPAQQSEHCTREYSNDTKFTWKRSLILKTHCVLKIFSKPRRVKGVKGVPEPLEKEINEILVSKYEDQFSNPFFELVQNTTLVRFSYMVRLFNFCKAPRDMQKFP